MKISPFNKSAYRLLHEGTLALAKIERNGIRIDEKYCKHQMKYLDKKIRIKEKKFKKSEIHKIGRRKFGSKFNPSSDKQLGSVLFDEMGIEPPKMTDSNSYSVDEESLEQIKLDELKILLDIRKLSRAKGTYLKNILRECVDGFVHPSFGLNIPRTFRSQSDSPNFQNIPIRKKDIGELIRKAFIPRNGHRFGEADYKGIEVNISQCYNQDLILRRDILEGDMHRDAAADCFILSKKEVSKEIRYLGKNGFVFPQFYGSWWKEIAAALWKSSMAKKIKTNSGKSLRLHMRRKFPEFELFETHIKKVEDRFWNKKFKTYCDWKDKWYRSYLRKGYFDTKTGFKCQGLMERNQVINYPIQGSAFHCLLWSLIELVKEIEKRKMKSLIIGQIHDSIVFDANASEFEDLLELIIDITSSRLKKEWSWITMPLNVEIEASPIDMGWDEKEEIKLGE